MWKPCAWKRSRWRVFELEAIADAVELLADDPVASSKPEPRR
jgi:hypothetical protein